MTAGDIERALPLIRERAQTFVQAADLVDPLFREHSRRTASPGLFEVLAILGRETSPARLSRAAIVAGG